MQKTQLTEDIHKMRFEEIYSNYTKGKLSCDEASEILGLSVRSFYRKRQRYESEDFDGRFDMRLGRPSPHRASDLEVSFITKLYAERYRGFSVRHFHEFAVREHGFKRSYSWTKNKLESAQLVKPSKRGGDHRLRRERRDLGLRLLSLLKIPGFTRLYPPSLGEARVRVFVLCGGVRTL